MKKLLTLFALAMMLGVQNANAIVYTALSGSNWNAGEGPAKLFDGTTNTKWGTHDDYPYVVFKTSSPIKPSEYKLVIANDTYKSGNNGRNWKNWKIYAGNFASESEATRNASGWVLIDNKQNQSLPTGTEQNPFAEQTLNISETVSAEYSYFKIEIEELVGDWNNYCQMDGFTFTAYTLPVGTVEFTCTAKQGNNSNASEGMEKLFDGVYTTKYCGDVTYTDAEQVVHPAYAIVEASSAVYCWGYEMTTANDNEQYGRCVKKWTLYGSNDASAKTDANHSSWVALSALAKNDLVQQKNNYTQRFFCDLDKVGTAYKYFKVTLDDGGSVQLTEFKLCYETCPVVSYNWESGYLSDTGRNSEAETKNAVDGLLNQKMEGNNLSGSWVIIKTANDNAYTVKSYSFSTHDDGNVGCNNRAPKTWIIEGSNDKSSWTTIDEVTSGDPIDPLNYKTFEFKPSNVDGAFKYIKLTLNSMKGTGWTQVGEFHVTNGCASHTWVDLDYVAPTCVSDGGGEKQCSVCGVTKLTGVEPATGNHTYDANGFCTVCNQPNPNFMTKNGDFYEPTTVVQFNWLKAMIQSGATVNIRLTQDVDLSGFAGFGNGEEVNDHLVPFSGEFDGGGHWIKNLHIDVVKKNTGFFGLTNGANFHDLGFAKSYVKVSGTQNVGTIVGNAKNTTFNRVAVMYGSYVEGYDHVGAFAGNTDGSCVISNCITDAEVYSTVYQAGGFVGTSSGLTLEKSLFLGSVRCGNGAGDVGGFISRIESNNSTTIRNNIMAATMLTTAKSDITTPLVAQHTNSTYENNYVAASTIFKSTDSNAADDLKAGKTMSFDNLNGYQGKTTDDAEMKVASFYTSPMGWDMENDWKFYKDGRYPVLQWMDGIINISNANELAAFASKVNDGMFGLDAQLTADIDMSGKTWEPIGNWSNSAAYLGHFDGQGHTISNLSITAGKEFHSLFGVVAKHAIIENFTVRGSLNNTGQNNLGVIGYAGTPDGWTVSETNVTIRNIHSCLDITTNANGMRIGGIVGSTHKGIVNIDRCSYSGTFQVTDTGGSGNYGGMVGFVETNADSHTNITNCLFDGTLSNTDQNATCTFGGIVGYIGSGPYATITNCLSVGTVTAVKAGQICGAIKSANSSISSCYYKGSTANSIVENNPSITATSVSDVQVTKGEVAYKMNGDQSNIIWTQTIGTDTNPTPSALPLPTSQQAYQVVANTSYTNLGSKISSDKLQLGTAEELTKFAAEVYAGNSAMNAELTGSIDMSGVTYTPIGTDTYKYAGTFNGKGNTISNLSIDQSSTSETGMFSVTNGATIQNIVFDNADVTGGNNTGIAAGKITNSSLVKDIVIKNSEVTSDKQNTGGVVGLASASTIQTCAVINTKVTGYDHVGAIAGNAKDVSTIQNNFSDSPIESTKYQVGGIVGVIEAATVTRNLFTGSVKGINDDACGLISRIDGQNYTATISKNMIAASSVTGSIVSSIVKNWCLDNVTFDDNYLLNKTDYSDGPKTLTHEDDLNGKQISWIDATTKDFYETTLGWNFTDDWKFTCGGKYPILKIMADEALPTQDVTVTSAGYATMVANYDYDFTSAPVETYAVTASASPGYVHLEPVTSAKHGEALLLKGSADTYTLTATATAQTTTAENLLKAAEEDIVSNGTMYALAKIDNVVGFYQVGTAESAVTIPAGKAYLEGVGGSVKAYIFDFDDDPDAISSLLASPEEEGQVYNLAGQRISKMQKGINIVNGKKILR